MRKEIRLHMGTADVQDADLSRSAQHQRVQLSEENILLLMIRRIWKLHRSQRIHEEGVMFQIPDKETTRKSRECRCKYYNKCEYPVGKMCLQFFRKDASIP